MNPFLAFALWFVTVTLALVLWMLRIYGAWAMQCPSGKVVHTLATAKAASKRARQRTEKPLAPYRCAVCGFWHVGQNTGLKKPAKTIRNNHQMRVL